MTARRALLRPFALFGVYLLFAALWLWPVLAALPGGVSAVPAAVPGGVTSDYYHFHWNYGWLRHAFAHGLDAYTTDRVFAPFTSSLALHTLTPFWFPLWAALEPLAGTAAAVAAIMLASIAFAGTTTHLLLVREGAAHRWAFAGGLAFALSPMFMVGVHWTNLNLMGWGWLPLMALTWRSAWEARGPRCWAWAAALGACAWAAVLIDVQAVLFAPFFIIPYMAIGLARVRTAGAVRAAGLAVCALVAAAVLLWAAGPLRPLLAYPRDGLAPTPAERAVAIDWPMCYITRCETNVSFGLLFVPGVLVTVGVLWARRRRPETRAGWAWLAAGAVPFALTFGAATPLYTLLHTLLGGAFRYPERFAPLAVLALLMAIAAAWRGWAFPARTGRTFGLLAAAAAVLVVVGDARIFRPLPTVPLPAPYATYAALADDTADYVVVTVPTGGMSGEGLVGDARWMQTQFYALTHGKRVAVGHLSRVETWHYMYMETSDPLMAWLGGRRFLEPEAAAAQLAERAATWPIGVIGVHERWLEPGTLGEIAAFLNAQTGVLCPPTYESLTLPGSSYSTVDGGLLAYRARWLACTADRVPPLAADGFVLDWGAPGDTRWLGTGWHAPETVGGETWRWLGAPPYAGAPEAVVRRERGRAWLTVDLPPGGYTVAVTAQSFRTPRALALTANGAALAAPTLVSAYGLETVRFALPADVVGDGRDVRIALLTDSAQSPQSVGMGDDTRVLGVAVSRIAFTSAP